MSKKNIIIDCDPGHDDMMAILLALAYQDKLNILGITTVAGNNTLEKVTLNLRKIFTYLDMYIPAASGSSKPIIRELVLGNEVHGESGLDGWDFPEPALKLESTNAVTFIKDKIMKCNDKVTLVPIGPLTNIGLLLATFPEVSEKIEQISLMGGSIYAGNITAHAEFNIYVDPEAASIVFNSGIPVTMSGLEVTHAAGITHEEIDRLKAKKGKVSKMCGHLLEFYVRYHDRTGYSSFPLHDVCSVLYLLNPEIFKYFDTQVEIECHSELHRGRTSADNREWMKYEHPNTRVLIDIDREKFIEILFDALAKLDDI